MKLNEKLKKLCEEKRWTGADLLRAIGGIVAKSTMSNYFKGEFEPDLETALAMSRALGVELEFLADEDAAWPPPPPELSADERMALYSYRKLRDSIGAERAAYEVARLTAKRQDHEEVGRAQPTREKNITALDPAVEKQRQIPRKGTSHRRRTPTRRDRKE